MFYVISFIVKTNIKKITFINPSTIRAIIASPFAWFAMITWLQGFAYRINISLWLFAISLIIVIVLTILTVGIHSYKASFRNPVEALRDE